MIRLRTVVAALMFALGPGLRAYAQPCVFDFDCNDTVECTIDICVSGACLHLNIDGASCNDDDACTEGETCQAGVCSGGSPVLGCVPCHENDDCEDGDPCTADVCEVDGRCAREGNAEGNTCDDDDPCTADDRCSEGTCAGTPLACDDGMACTDDFCDAGACMHQPQSGLCTAPNECAAAVCLPDDPAADAQGCVARSGSLESNECTEDDNPCTVDRCRGGACSHDAVDDPSGCLPLVPSYRRAVDMRAGVGRLENFLREVDAGGDTGRGLFDQLDLVAAELEAAIRVLAGRDAGAVPAALPPPRLFGGQQLAATTTAQQRGRVALAWVRGAPSHVQDFLGIVSKGRRTQDLTPDDARELRRNGRILLADTKALKRDVKNLQRTFSVFQR